MSARARSQQYPLIGTRVQAPFTDNAPTVTPAVITASGVSASIDTDEFGEGLLFIATSAVSGTTPSVSYQLQTSPDGVTWANVGAAVVASAIGNSATPFGAMTPGGAFGYLVRVAYTVTGTTPSFTVAAWFLGK